MKTMARMTEEEAFALDEKWTKTDPGEYYITVSF
jgi:hypothetical protein